MSEDLETQFDKVARLNVTARVQHILDGESDISIDEESIPSPVNQENVTNDDDKEQPTAGDGDSPESENEAGDVSGGQPGEGNPENQDAREILAGFFNLSEEDQGSAVLTYRKSINDLLTQNERMTAMVQAVNVKRERMAAQVNAAMEDNWKLLEELKTRPDVRSITKQATDEVHKAYDERMKELIKDKHDALAEEKEQHKKQIAENDKYYDGLLTKALKKVKKDYNQKVEKELEEQNKKFLEEHHTQQALIASLNDKVAKLKKQRPTPAPRDRSNISSTSNTTSDRLGNLRKDIFDYCPGTVKTTRGGACNNTSIDWTVHSTNKGHPGKHVTFSMSTPLKPDYVNISENEILAMPLAADGRSSQKSGLSTEQSTLNILANEFKKLNPPKLQKLKGGTSPSAQLFFSGWVKEFKSIIKD